MGSTACKNDLRQDRNAKMASDWLTKYGEIIGIATIAYKHYVYEFKSLFSM